MWHLFDTSKAQVSSQKGRTKMVEDSEVVGDFKEMVSSVPNRATARMNSVCGNMHKTWESSSQTKSQHGGDTKFHPSKYCS